MTAHNTLGHTHPIFGTHQGTGGQAAKNRIIPPSITHHYSTRRFSTTQCSRCQHTFLRYAAACPECGLVRRRKKNNKAKTRAILCSAIAIALTCLFISQTNSQDGIKRALPAYPSLASAAPARPAVKPQESGKVRYLVVREADLARMQYGPRIGTK